eukprot:Anaeramoba_flamelloidesa330735_15.p1 GENE.a330735_15~~a330735_15.p1  ORF type:complete len:106 (-),score=16.68 a330735_15:264-581(-)
MKKVKLDYLFVTLTNCSFILTNPSSMVCNRSFVNSTLTVLIFGIKPTNSGGSCTFISSKTTGAESVEVRSEADLTSTRQSKLINFGRVKYLDLHNLCHFSRLVEI